MEHLEFEPGHQVTGTEHAVTGVRRRRFRAGGLAKRLASVAAGIAIVLGLQALPAGAATGSRGFGDCKLSVWMEAVYTYTGYGKYLDVRGVGSVPCSNRHASTTATVELKKAFSTVRTASTTFTNSYGLGTRHLQTAYDIRPSGCDYYQAVMKVAISGLGSTYVTTGSPDWLCI